jgi:formylglycine-generating enzyme required for sulfatase activity
MVEIPPGFFNMGQTESNPGAFKRVSWTLEVGKYPVTFEQWEFCLANGGCGGYRPFDNGWGRGNRPVVNVSWNDAHRYVDWLSKYTGKTYRLPTDVEREYFTRAGTTTRYWWGDDIDPTKANYSSSAYAAVNAPVSTQPVDAYRPNPWGLYQVHGNIWEWVEDCRDWNGDTCERRILRGGGWDMGPEILRSANSGQNTPLLRGHAVGFRVVRTLGTSPEEALQK